MRIFGFILSVVFHVGLVLMALAWSVTSPTKISLDSPVYKVDLISLAPAPESPAPKPKAVKPVDSKKAPEPVQKTAKPDAVSIPKPKPAASKPETEAKELPKTKPAPIQKAKPKQQEISPKKVKTTFTKKEKDKPVQKAEQPKKKEPVKKTEVQKKVAKKEKPKPPPKKEPSGEDLLAGALSDLRKEVKAKEDAERTAVAKELAGLREEAQAAASEIEGDGTASATGLVQVYGQIVRQTVKKNWRYPVFGAHQQNLTAAVEIQLKSDGTITGIRIVKTSGNVDYDDSVLSALKDTEILPEPPGNSIKKIVVNFNLHDLDS